VGKRPLTGARKPAHCGRVRVAKGVAVLILLAACGGGVSAAPPASPLNSGDRFLITCTRSSQIAIPALTGQIISEAQAVERACEEEGRNREANAITAELGWYRSDAKVNPVLVWRVTYHGVVGCLHGVSGQSTAAPACGYMEDVVVIDAHSGAFLVASTGKYEGPVPGA
jgi:hypothetical protein